MDASLLIVIGMNFVGALLFFLCFLPALKSKLVAHGYSHNLAYLSLVPVVFIGVLTWFVITPDRPNAKDTR